MSYDHEKFLALRSLEVPHKLALALSDDSNPLAAQPPILLPNITNLPVSSPVNETDTVVNSLLDALKEAGIMEPDA